MPTRVASLAKGELPVAWPPLADRARRSFASRACPLLALVVAAALFTGNLGGRKSLDGHEVLVAQTAREMLTTGNWVHPTFTGQPRYQKPPLAYWLAATAYHTTGEISERTARMPSAVSAILLVGLVMLVATRWFGAAAGVWSGFIQATSFWTIAYGKSALVDMTLALLVSLAILVAAHDRLLQRSYSTATAVLAFWTATGLAVLAKGPVALAFVLPTVLLYRVNRRLQPTRPTDRAFLRTWWHGPGLALFLLIAGLWPSLVLGKHPDVLWLWLDQSVGRFVSHFGPQTRPWYYYLYQVPLLTLPWTPLWVAEIVRRIRRPRASLGPAEADACNACEQRLLWIWFAVGLLFLTLSEGKREHYILPALVPLSMLAAISAERMRKRHRLRNHPPLLAAAAVSLLVVVFVAEYCVVPRFDPWRNVRAMVQRRRESIDNAEIVVQFGSNDHAPVFFVDRPMQWTSELHELERLAVSNPRAILLARSADLPWLTSKLPLEVLDRSESGGGGFALARVAATPRS